MFGRRNTEVSSRQVGQELSIIYGARQQSVDRSDELIEQVTDTPAKTAAEFAQSYYETFFDTPAKQMLWTAEGYISSVEAAHAFYFKIRDVADTLKIDLVESLSTVMPDEGWRVLQTIPDGPEKVEALAKFGKNTDPVFIQQARTLAYRLDPDYRRSRVNNLLRIADFAQDDFALELVYQEAKRDLGSQAKDDVDWETVDYFINAASLGHAPALVEAKRLVLANLGRVKVHESHWLEEMTLVSYIDELMKRGALPTRAAPQPQDMPAYEQVEARWQDSLMKRRDQITAKLHEGVELPAFDCLTHDMYSIAIDAKNYSTLQTPSEIVAYINAKAEEYAQALMSRGLEEFPAITLAADQPGVTYGIPPQQLLQNIKDFRAQWRKVVLPGPRRTDEEEADLYNGSNIRMFRALNRIAVFRALCLAGVGLNSPQPDHAPKIRDRVP
ncbi:MAG TPA: hypothetical protein VFT49_01710 [Candidatus Saccharimonadales bacterium]|nr:hypothetical protein [Candidatus Saccharimonadales bacterium]